MKKSFGVKRLQFATVKKYDRMATREDFSGFGGEQDFAMANGMASARSTEPYVLNIANANVGATQNAIIFGRNKYGAVANYGSGADITITMAVSTVPYAQLLQQSASEPFEISKIRLSSTSVTQLDQSIDYQVTDASGVVKQYPITVSSYLSPDQFQSTLRDIDQKLQINGSTALVYPILASTSVTMSIYISAKVNVAEPLVGKGAIEEFTKARVRSFKN